MYTLYTYLFVCQLLGRVPSESWLTGEVKDYRMRAIWTDCGTIHVFVNVLGLFLNICISTYKHHFVLIYIGYVCVWNLTLNTMIVIATNLLLDIKQFYNKCCLKQTAFASLHRSLQILSSILDLNKYSIIMIRWAYIFLIASETRVHFLKKQDITKRLITDAHN